MARNSDLGLDGGSPTSATRLPRAGPLEGQEPPRGRSFQGSRAESSPGRWGRRVGRGGGGALRRGCMRPTDRREGGGLCSVSSDIPRGARTGLYLPRNGARGFPELELGKVHVLLPSLPRRRRGQ